MHYVSRILRSTVIALIMFVSVKALGFNVGQASLAAAIPFLLGSIDVMAGTAFTLSATIFIFAVLAHVFPTEFLMIRTLVSSVVNEAGSELVVSGSSYSATPAPSSVFNAPTAPTAPASASTSSSNFFSAPMSPAAPANGSPAVPISATHSPVPSTPPPAPASITSTNSSPAISGSNASTK